MWNKWNTLMGKSVEESMTEFQTAPRPDSLRQLSFAVVLVFLWVMMILLGSIMLETFMIYPNIFHNAPERFEIALKFMSVTGPAQYFRPLGMATVFMGLAAVILGWRVRAARWWIVASVLMIICEGASSMIFFWPRNTILFVEGASVDFVEVLRQTARRVSGWHWSRLAFNAASAAFIFVGFMQLHR